MLRILWSSKSAMAAQQEKLDSISNNIANVNTEGYKRVDVSFKDLVYETLNRQGYPNSKENADKAYNGTGVRTSELIRDNSQGNLNETDNNNDFAIDGEGYFQVILPEKNADGTYKTAFTRDGGFNVDADGTLTDKNGDRVDISFYNNTSAEDRQLSNNNFKIDENGVVTKIDGDKVKEIGKINLYSVVSPDSLSSIGNNLYVVKTETVNGVQVPVEKPYLVQDSSIRQGFLELSNVDLPKEMTDMIVTQRAFELSSKAMKSADDLWGMVNNLRSK